MALSLLEETTPGASGFGAGSHAGTGGTKFRNVGNRAETIDEQWHYRIWNARLVGE
jgi:hypothetical protein